MSISVDTKKYDHEHVVMNFTYLCQKGWTIRICSDAFYLKIYDTVAHFRQNIFI